METKVPMKKYYICRDFTDACGISKYGSFFYSSILEPHSFKKIHLKNKNDVIQTILTINNTDKVWIEIGLGSHLETLCLKKLIKKKNPNIVITVHDAPFIEYPIIKFSCRHLNIISKLTQYVILRWPFTLIFYKHLYKIKRFYTLNPKGTTSIKNRYHLTNVKTIPHILTNILDVQDKKLEIPQLLYFGFIGKNKGVEYALMLHEKINQQLEQKILIKIIGKTLDTRSEFYFQALKNQYSDNVEYMGYVEDNELDILMKEDNIVLLPTKNYRVINPTSGSILNSLKYLNIVFTTKANSNRFIINDKFNGFFLEEDIDKDSRNIILVIKDKKLRNRMRTNIFYHLIEHYNTSAVIAEIKRDDYT